MAASDTSLTSRKQQEQIFFSSCENVRELAKSLKVTKRDINSDILRGKESDLLAHTKLLALLYCCYAEALFTKIVHTPYGLDLRDVNDIRRQRDIVSKWNRCIELAVGQLSKGRPNLDALDEQGQMKRNHPHNVEQALKRMVERYVSVPVTARNKLAHGQYVQAFNSGMTRLNNETTALIGSLNVVRIETDLFALEQLSAILEDLIETPKKGHFRYYFPNVVELESELQRRDKFTLEAKKMRLKEKREKYRPPNELCC